MATNGLFAISEERKQQQYAEGRAQIESHIGQRAIWDKTVNLSFVETPVTIEGVKYGKVAWYLVRDDEGAIHRVKLHNIKFRNVERLS